MPSKDKGPRRPSWPERLIIVFAYLAIIQQWLSRLSVAKRIVLGVVLYYVLALSAFAAFSGNACAVTVNGNVVAIAADEGTAREALSGLIRLKSDQSGWSVAVSEKISYRGIKVKQEDILDCDSLAERLDNALTFTQNSTAIVVNGETKVCVAQKKDAEELLAWLKSVFPTETGEQLEFKERIELVEAPADLQSVLDLETAKNVVLLGARKIQQYTVKDGDTLWDIARSVKIDMDQIEFTNPGLDPERLSIGQVLNLSKEHPLITVLATREVTLEEDTPYDVEVRTDDNLLYGEKMIIRRGVPGKRLVTYRIIRENGFETEREVLDQKILSESTPEVVARGSLNLLASRGGNGRLNWPCAGGIVSYFGMRSGRMHEGIDIGAGYGYKVVASAGGTIIGAGWSGGYGNIIEISHGGGLVTKYAHLSSINVKRGQTVERGQLIGYVGSTGRSTGPHLHFEVLINGEPRNPVNYLP